MGLLNRLPQAVNNQDFPAAKRFRNGEIDSEVQET